MQVPNPLPNLFRPLLSLWKRSAVMLAVLSETLDSHGNQQVLPVGPDNPLHVIDVSGGGGGGGNTDAATETTLAEIYAQVGLMRGDTNSTVGQLTLIKNLLNAGVIALPPTQVAIGFSTFTLEGTDAYQISDNLPQEATSYTVQAIGSDVRYLMARFGNENPTPTNGMVLYEGEREHIYSPSPARFASVSASGCKLSVIWWR